MAATVFAIGYANRQRTIAIDVSPPPDAITGATSRLMPSVQLQTSVTAHTDLQAAFNLVAREVEPAVVHLHITKQTDTRNLQNPVRGLFFFPGTPMVRNIAGNEPNPTASQTTPSNQFIGNVGSGFFIHPKGYILTNYHLVSGAREIEVILYGSPDVVHSATLFDADPDIDLAVLKLDVPGVYSIVELGDSNNIEVGDWVLAVGSPFGLEHTVTAGIISDTARDLLIQGKQYKNLIQTDAPINEGNSGGPLVDLNGEVVGINTALYTPDGGFIGIGFSIPVNQSLSLIANIVDKPDPAAAKIAAQPSVPNPSATTPPAPALPQYQNAAAKQLAEGHWLGMEVIPSSPELTNEMGISPAEKGVLVDDVTLVAADAGIVAGDMVQQIGKSQVNDLKSFYEATKKVARRREVTIRISRKGLPLTIEIEQRDPVGIAQMEAAPMIPPGSVSPHRYKGDCTKCHTIGSTGQLAIDQGDIISRTAPAITRGAAAPHRNRGECGLCHQIR
ncbi:MAG: trypsin-like peptidase domain-containing protein [bacterium]